MKLCECGCGLPTMLAVRTQRSRGQIKGQPCQFIIGHKQRMKIGALSSRWKGGRGKANGYQVLIAHERPRVSNRHVYIGEHVLIAERALGRRLPDAAEVHHWNEIKTDNRNRNLVICESRAYHMLLHQRMRAYRASGSVHGIKCRHCKEWGLPGTSDFTWCAEQSCYSYHRSCEAAKKRQRGAV